MMGSSIDNRSNAEPKPRLLVSDSVNWEAVVLAACLRGVPPTFVSIADASGVSPGTLRNWETDRVSVPSISKVAAVADALNVPRRFLMRNTPIPQTTNLTFRRKSPREMSRERAMLASYATLTAMFAKLLLGQKWSDARIPDPLVEPDAWTNGQICAKNLRERLGIDLKTPMPNLVDLAESLGVLVVYGPAMPDGLDACSAVVDGQRIIVVRHNDTDYYRQRWDIAHELGHFVMGHDEAGRENESAANEFAEGLLFPWTTANHRRLLGAVRDADDLDSLFNIQADWGVSIDALITAAKKHRIRTAQEKALLLEAHREAELDVLPTAESPTVLPDAALEQETLRGRPYEMIAKEEGFAPDLVRLMLSRAAPQAVASETLENS